MIFRGVGRRFSTADDGQYEAIGDFWDRMAERFGRENLCGLGWNWHEDSLTYAVGMIDCPFAGDMPGMQAYEVALPENGWQRWRGETERLDELYAEIYRGGPLMYEIERFSDDGSCAVDVYREQK